MKNVSLLAASTAWLFLGCQLGADAPARPTPIEPVADELAATADFPPPADGPVTIERSYCDKAGCELVFTFSRDMVEAASLAGATPVEVVFEPLQKGKLAWRSPRELVFTPGKEALQWGHDVKVSIAAAVPVEGASYALAKPWVEEFRVPYFSAAGKVASWPIVLGRPRFITFLNDYDWQGRKIGRGPVYLLFDQPVTAAEVEKHVRASHHHRNLGVITSHPKSLSDIHSGEIDNRLVVAVAARKLPADGEVVALQYPNILESGVPEIANQEFVTTTRFELDSFVNDNAAGESLVAVDSEWHINFNNSVSATRLKAAISLDPPAPDLQVSWVWGGEAYVRATLTPGTAYKLTVDKDLVDKLGNRLGKSRRLSFKTHDLAPVLAMPDGPLTLERGHAEVPVRATNVGAITAKLKSFASPAAFISALAAGDCSAATAASHDLAVAAPGKVNKAALRTIAIDKPMTLGCLDLSAAGTGSRRSSTRLGRAVMVQVTGLGVTVKAEAGGVVAWVTRLSDAAPVPGAKVGLIDGAGVVKATAVSDGDGIARLYGGALTTRGGLAGLGFVVAETGSDLAVARLADDQLAQPWQYGLNGDVRDVDAMSAALFTDRGVYRPGEKVHAVAIVRDRRAKHAPASGKVAVTVADPRGRELLSRDLALDEFGSAAVDVTLPIAAAVGRYSLRMERGDSVTNRSFLVEEYRVPSFEVAVASDQRSWSAEQSVDALISARYLHGGELAARQVSYSVARDRAYFRPTGYGQYTFINPDAKIPVGSLLSREGRLDGQGRVGLSFLPRHPSTAGPMRYVVEATVSDVDRQVYSGRMARVVHPTDFYLGLRAPSRSIMAAGERLEIPVVALTPSGKPRAGVKASVKLERIDHHTTARLAGMSVERVNRQVISKVAECKVKTSARVAMCKFELERAGEYRVVASARDSGKRRVETGFSLTVSGDDPVAWPRFEHERIDLIADKGSYRPGDTARLMVESPFRKARGLLSIERAGVIEHRLFTIDGDAPALEIPITREHAPNVYASVVLIRGRIHDKKDATGFATGAPSFRMGYIELAVSPIDYRLDVAVRPSQSKAHPKAPLTIDVDVRDQAGNPVTGQATVMVVDEAVLGLTAARTPDPVAQLFSPRPLGVRTAASILDLPDSRRARHEQIFPGGDGGGGFAVGELGPGMRTLFESTAYFNAAVKVRDGHAQVRFDLPDNITTYRVMAVAVDKKARSGSGDAPVQVRKPLMVQPVLPRFVHPGDELRIEALVFNGTDSRGRARLAVSAAGLALTGAATQQLAVDGNASKVFGFPARVTSGKEVVLRFAGSLDGHGDIVEARIPILDPGASRRVVINQQVTGKADLAITLPGDRIDGSARVEVMVSTSRLSRLKESVGYLMDYPNGCIEQTTSSAYPLVVLEDLLPDMGVTVDPVKLKEYATAGIKRLLSFQTSSGGLSYWPGEDEPHAFGTAFGLTALIAGKARGYDVPDEALGRMADYLEQELASGKISGEMPHGSMADADTRALFVMTLGRIGRPQPGHITNLWRKRDKLTAFGMAFLAVAVSEMDGDNALLEPILAEVRRKAKEEAQEAYFVGDRAGGWSMGSPLRTHASALLAYAVAQPKHEMSRKLMTGLLNRQRGGQWGNTQENVFGIMAVAAAVGSAKGKAPEVAVTINGAAFDLGKGEKVGTHARRLGLADKALALTSGHDSAQKIAITNRGSGPVQVSVRAEYEVELSPANRQPRSQGFVVTRSYLSANGRSVVDPAAVALGSLVRVKLRVVSDKKHNYVAIADKLPAGLEPLNANLATTESVDLGRASQAVKRGLGVLSYSEVRDARVAFYADDLPAGTYEFEYLARATTPGTFLRPAAGAEAMYEPESYGYSAIDTVVVK